MNVLYIIGGEGNRYGSEIIAIDLISAGKKNGIKYTVICATKGAVSEACDRLGVENYVIPFRFFVYKKMENKALEPIKRTVWRVRAEYLTYRAVRAIENTIDLTSIDIIHTNLSRDLLGGIIAKKHCIPHIWHIHELYKSHYQLSFLRKGQVEWMANHASLFIAISHTVASEWIESGLPENKMKVVYNGIDFNSIDIKNEYRVGNTLKLVMVGHIVPAKGQEKVIEMLAGLPDEMKKNITLDCFGEGEQEYKERLKIKAKNSSVDLRLKGYCGEIGKLLKNYDIGINCSRGEGFGLSTVEYMAAGICPVVANTGANEEIVDNEKTGYVFDYTKEESFVQLIKSLYMCRDEMTVVSKAAMKEVRSKYTVEKMCGEVYSAYSSYTI